MEHRTILLGRSYPSNDPDRNRPERRRWARSCSRPLVTLGEHSGSWGPCMPDQLRGADRRQRDVHHGDELGCPKRAQRSRRFEPGIVVCHPGGGSRVWDGSRWAGHRSRLRTRGFQEATCVPRGTGHRFGTHRRRVCSSQAGGIGRSLRLCLAASVMGFACPGRWRVAGFALGFLALEGVWCAVSLFGLCKAFRGLGQPERDGSSDSSRVSTCPGAGRAAKG